MMDITIGGGPRQGTVEAPWHYPESADNLLALEHNSSRNFRGVNSTGGIQIRWLGKPIFFRISQATIGSPHYARVHTTPG